MGDQCSNVKARIDIKPIVFRIQTAGKDGLQPWVCGREGGEEREVNSRK